MSVDGIDFSCKRVINVFCNCWSMKILNSDIESMANGEGETAWNGSVVFVTGGGPMMRGGEMVGADTTGIIVEQDECSSRIVVAWEWPVLIVVGCSALCDSGQVTYIQRQQIGYRWILFLSWTYWLSLSRLRLHWAMLPMVVFGRLIVWWWCSWLWWTNMMTMTFVQMFWINVSFVTSKIFGCWYSILLIYTQKTCRGLP